MSGEPIMRASMKSAPATIEMPSQAPVGLGAQGDATFSKIECESIPGPDLAQPRERPSASGRDLMGLVVTWGCSAVYHATKSIDCIVESSMHGEAKATIRLGEILEHACNVAENLGVAVKGNVMLGTDNVANRRISSGEGNAGRSKHIVRNYCAFRRRVAAGICTPFYVPDEDNMSDFLTKWIGKKKVRRSLDYLTNARARKMAAVEAHRENSHVRPEVLPSSPSHKHIPSSP